MSREGHIELDAHLMHARAGSAATRVLDRMRQAYCGLQGHDNLLQFARDRMFLKCVTCGHESPGWEIAEPNRPPKVQPSAARTRVGTPLLDARRIA